MASTLQRLQVLMRLQASSQASLPVRTGGGCRRVATRGSMQPSDGASFSAGPPGSRTVCRRRPVCAAPPVFSPLPYFCKPLSHIQLLELELPKMIENTPRLSGAALPAGAGGSLTKAQPRAVPAGGSPAARGTWRTHPPPWRARGATAVPCRHGHAVVPGEQPRPTGLARSHLTYHNQK
jgi:hypothetical protein